ncbi:MAG: hypothetical protein INQ03_14350 [Candidatus Heimdallarchaeota archaeon]|nr:hypothetical protein [Candidatus Heimdallarchaeota archaeon]
MIIYLIKNDFSTTSSSTSAHPKITLHYDFTDPESAIRNFYPEVINAGADIVIILAHDTPNKLITLANDVSVLNILFLGGYGGTPGVYSVGSSLITMADHMSKGFVVIDLSFDTSTNTLTSINGSLIANIDGTVPPVTLCSANSRKMESMF